MAILALALGFAAAGIVALVLGALLGRAAPQARVLRWAGGVLVGVALIVGAYDLATRGGSSICARTVVCCKVAANGQHPEVCENWAAKPDEECRASIQSFRHLVEQHRPALLTECD